MIAFLSFIINTLLVLGVLLLVGFTFVYGLAFLSAFLFVPFVKIKNKDYKNLWINIIVALSIILLIFVILLPESN